MLLTLALSMVIGLLLGVLGGGGSILTVPMLVYLLHVEPKTAIVTSFVVVGVSSVLALIPHARRHAVCWKSGLFFGLSGMVGAFGGGRLAGLFSADFLMLLFGLVSIATGSLMLRGKKPAAAGDKAGQSMSLCPLKVPYLRVLFDGFFVGGLTGMVGVGGGFLIVPALTLLVGLPMHGAVGTSLLIIIMNALAGLGGYSQHAELDQHLTLLVMAGALTGSGLGGIVSGRIKPALLQRGFGAMVVAIGCYVVSQATSAQLLESGVAWLASAKGIVLAGLGLVLLWGLLRLGGWIHKTDGVVFASHNPADGR